MKIKELSKLVEEVERLFKAADARGQTADLSAVRAWLDTAPEQDVSAFLANVEIDENSAPSLTKLQIVGDWVKRLKDAGLDQSKFEANFAELTNDRSVRKDEACAIARSYAKTRQAISSKAKAFALIRAKYVELAQAEAKNRIIDTKSTTPW